MPTAIAQSLPQYKDKYKNTRYRGDFERIKCNEGNKCEIIQIMYLCRINFEWYLHGCASVGSVFLHTWVSHKAFFPPKLGEMGGK